MTTTPQSLAPFAAGTAVLEDLARVVQALGSSLDPAQQCAAIRDGLAARARLPVEVFLIDHEAQVLRNPLHGVDLPLPGRLAARLQVQASPFAVDRETDPARAGRTALGLRDGDEVVGLALFADTLAEDPGWAVIAALGGANLSRALRFDELARLTGASEQTRSLQQQILDHVSHEFNTPLMILRSSADFARDASAEERELFFDMHAQALDRLEQLVRGVIEVAHTSARGDRQPVGTEEVVSSMVLPQFVDAEWPGGVPDLWHRATDAQVEVDPEGLALAVEHLVQNARVHAAAAGAKVAVAVYATGADGSGPRLKDALAALAAGDESLPADCGPVEAFCVEVVDNGSGIPATDLGLIFQPFTQASNSPLRGVSGAGMGLATASRLVEEAGGRIEVESQLGAGSLFRLRLPVR